MKAILCIATCLLVLPACGSGENEAATTEIPVIAIGHARCALCGMTIQDARFAPALRDPDQGLLSFDAIECLIQERREHGGSLAAEIWLPDMLESKLYPAQEMTVVAAGFPSPMGGGFAAFRDSLLAGRLAAERGGRVGSLEEFVQGGQMDGSH